MSEYRLPASIEDNVVLDKVRRPRMGSASYGKIGGKMFNICTDGIARDVESEEYTEVIKNTEEWAKAEIEAGRIPYIGC